MKILEIFERYDNFIIVSYDAGGGNVLASLIKEWNILKRCSFIIDGPSTELYLKKFGKITTIALDTIPTFEKSNTLVLTSTSGNAELERTAIDIAKKNNFMTCSILDHWSNFKLRFVPLRFRDQIEVIFHQFLPNVIITTDQKAYDLVKQFGLKDDRLILIENPYLKKLRNDFAMLSSPTIRTNRILYMSEYFLSPKDSLLSEMQYLEDILIQIDRFAGILPHDFNFYIRLHPTENKEKYSQMAKRFRFVTIGEKSLDLVDDLSKTKMVIGKSSMGLVVAAELGVPTFSYRHNMFEFLVIDSRITVIDQIDLNLLLSLFK